MVAQVDSPEPLCFSIRLGARLPLLETTSGAVLLAFEDPPVAAELLAGMVPDATDRQAVIQRLTGIRRAGFEQVDSRAIEGIIDVSVPVLDHTGRATAALSVPFLKLRGPRTSLEPLRAQLAAAAARISAAVGATPVISESR